MLEGFTVIFITLRCTGVGLKYDVISRRNSSESTVPTQWKISRMYTIYKLGDTSDRGNYRPLQMLSVPAQQAPRSNSMRRPGPRESY